MTARIYADESDPLFSSTPEGDFDSLNGLDSNRRDCSSPSLGSDYQAPVQRDGRSWKNSAQWVLLCSLLFSTFYAIMLGHEILRNVSTNSANKNVAKHRISTTDFPIPKLALSKSFGDREKNVEVLVVYGPEDDPWQKGMAEKVVEGCNSIPNTTVKLETISTATFQDVLDADAVIIGAPVENANTHHKVQEWININWDIQADLSEKVGGAFVTAGGISAGQESTLRNLLSSMMIFRMIVVGGETWLSAFGAAAVTYETPFTEYKTPKDDKDSFFPEICYLEPGELLSPMFLSKAYGLGSRVAHVAHKISGSYC